MRCHVCLVTRLTLSNNGLQNANAKSNQAILEVPNQSLDFYEVGGGLHVWGSPCPMFWEGDRDKGYREPCLVRSNASR